MSRWRAEGHQSQTNMTFNRAVSSCVCLPSDYLAEEITKSVPYPAPPVDAVPQTLP
jgi:hypothetical protein